MTAQGAVRPPAPPGFRACLTTRAAQSGCRGWLRRFQPSMKTRILVGRSRTDGEVRRRSPLALDDPEPDLDQRDARLHDARHTAATVLLVLSVP